MLPVCIQIVHSLTGIGRQLQVRQGNFLVKSEEENGRKCLGIDISNSQNLFKNKTKIYLSYISLAKQKIWTDEKVSLKKTLRISKYIFLKIIYISFTAYLLFKKQLVVQEQVFLTHFRHHLVFGYDQIEYYIIEALTGTLYLVLPQSRQVQSTNA